MKWFPDPTGYRKKFSDNLTAKTLCNELLGIFQKCLLHPIEAYTEARKNQDVLLKLSKINAEATLLEATENTVMAVDQEHTVLAETIEKLVDTKVKQALKKQQQQLTKNKPRGANNTTATTSASLKKKTPPKNSSNKPAPKQKVAQPNKQKGNSQGGNNNGSGSAKNTKNPSETKFTGRNKNTKPSMNTRNKKSGQQSKKRMD